MIARQDIDRLEMPFDEAQHLASDVNFLIDIHRLDVVAMTWHAAKVKGITANHDVINPKLLSKVERIVTIAYLSMVKIDRTLDKNLDDHQACWVALKDVKTLAFDHNLIIKEAMTYIRQFVEFNPSMLFELLPRKFTAAQLRTLFELVYDKAVDVRNFHKKIAMMEYVVPLEEKQQGVAHRAARYYKFDKKVYNKVRR